MTDLLQRCAMCGHLLPRWLIVTCEACGETFCEYCFTKHGEDACGQ